MLDQASPQTDQRSRGTPDAGLVQPEALSQPTAGIRAAVVQHQAEAARVSAAPLFKVASPGLAGYDAAPVGRLAQLVRALP